MPGTTINVSVDPHKRLLDCLTALRDRCLSKAGLAIGTSSTSAIKIVNTTAFVLNGIVYSKASAEVAFTATTMDIAADASAVKEAVYLLSLSNAGTPTLTMGAIATGAGNAVVPATPSGNCTIGYVRIAVAAGSTPFDASSDALSAGHLTVTYVDLSVNAKDYEY